MEGGRFGQLICWIPCWSGITPTGKVHASMYFFNVFFSYLIAFLSLLTAYSKSARASFTETPSLANLFEVEAFEIYIDTHLESRSLIFSLSLHSCIHISTLSLFLGSAAREVVLAQQKAKSACTLRGILYLSPSGATRQDILRGTTGPSFIDCFFG